MDAAVPELMHWRSVAGRKQALAFTAEGWALAEACALLSKHGQPQTFLLSTLGRIIGDFVRGDVKDGPELTVEWESPDHGLTATMTFQTAALKALSAICDMEVGELQSAVQSSLETELLDMYDQHKDKQQLH